MTTEATEATIEDADGEVGFVSVARPFIKWPGGKWKLGEELIKHFPSDAIAGTYMEPFAGAGAITYRWALPRGLRVALSDTDHGLIASYLSVRDHVDDLIGTLGEMSSKMVMLIAGDPRAAEDMYYEVRASYNDRKDAPIVKVGASFIFLHKLCFNGLHRVDSRGRFNASWGKWTKAPNICDAALLRSCSKALELAEVRHLDFEQAAMLAKKGDFVYLDPPYDGTWSGYQAGGFRGGSEQVGLFDREVQRPDIERLKDVCLELDRRGVPWVMSNGDTDRVRALFGRWTIHEIDAPTTISRKAESRGTRRELVVTSYASPHDMG